MSAENLWMDIENDVSSDVDNDINQVSIAPANAVT
jgi:hypothetical protein